MLRVCVNRAQASNRVAALDRGDGGTGSAGEGGGRNPDLGLTSFKIMRVRGCAGASWQLSC